MKPKKKLTTRFAPDTRFEVATQSAVPFRATQQTAFETLHARLLSTLLRQANDPELNLLFRHAANEAAALAQASGFPTLLFPVLLEEKATSARRYASRQAGVLRRSSLLAGIPA